MKETDGIDTVREYQTVVCSEFSEYGLVCVEDEITFEEIMDAYIAVCFPRRKGQKECSNHLCNQPLLLSFR